MSDIFKKIRSIEAEDDAVTDALGLARPDSGVAADSPDTPRTKSLHLSIPEDDDILDLEHLSLEDDLDTENFKAEDIDLSFAAPERLGLTPILPIKAPDLDIPKPSKPLLREPLISNPLPNFMDRKPKDVPDAAELTTRIAEDEAALSSSPRERAEVKFIEHPTGHDPYKSAALNDAPPPMQKFITIMGFIAGIIWLLCVGLLLADMLGRTGAWASMPALQKLGFTLMALFPLVLIGLTTYAFRHISALSNASGKLKVTAESLVTPDDTVITRSTIMAKSIMAQVDEVNLKVSTALTRMELLDDMVKSQSSSLSQSTLAIDTTANDVEHRITAQREGLESIAGLFEDRLTALSAMMESHSSHLASSGQMAEQRVQEARISVEGAAEKIASASETVRQNAVAAAQTLSGSHVEITKLGDDVQAQSTRLDSVYRQHLADLRTMLTDLRAQQDELGATMEERLSKMRDMSLSAKVGAESLTEASVKGRETVEALNEAAALTDTAVRARFSEMEDMVKYSTARAESISETAARQVQSSLSSTRKEIARIEADMMDLMSKLKDAEVSQTTPKQTSPSPAPMLRNTPSEEPDLPSMEFRDIVAESERPLFNMRKPVSETSPPHPDNVKDLTFLTPVEDDLPAVLRRPSGESEAKDRGKWSLRGLFNSDNDSAATPQAVVSDSEIISRLTKLGLTPAAIVDDGCIIEAANLRKVKGATEMSEAVAKRLSEPVRHLFMAIETDADLKSDVRTFTAQFDAGLAPIENDREGIRTRLESDAGRAYLLCHAALTA